VKRYRTEITADNMIMLDRKGGGSEFGGDRAAGGIQSSASQSAPADKGEVPNEEVAIEDLPF